MSAHAQVQNLLFRMHISLCAAAGGAVRRNPAPQLLEFKRWQTCLPELRKTVRSRRHHELGRDRRPVEAAYRLGARALGETHWERLEGDSREEGSVAGRIQERYGVPKTESEKQADEWSHALE